MIYDFTIIIPVFNEKGNLLKLEEVLLEYFKTSSLKTCAVFVDDGSTDQTMNELEKFKDSIRIIRHDGNLGYGAAIKTGLFYSKGESIAFMDFDGTT